MSYPTSNPMSPSSGAPPPPPPKTREDFSQAPHSTAPTPPYHSHPAQSTPQPYFPSGQSTPQPPSRPIPQLSSQPIPTSTYPPQRPPSHPALTYAEQQSSPPQFYEPKQEQSPVELGGDESAFAAGRVIGAQDRLASSQLPPPQPPPPPQPQPYRQHHSPDPGGASQPAQHPQAEPQFPPEGWLPDILHDKSKGDLEHILNTPSLLTALLHHPTHQPAILKYSNSTLRSHLDHTSQLAQRTSNTAAQVEQERQRVQAHLLRARAAEQTWRRKQAEMDDALEPFGPRALHRRLVGAVKEGEEALSAVTESWLGQEGVASEREVGEWVKSVREGRRIVELRRERRGRWEEGRVGGWR